MILRFSCDFAGLAAVSLAQAQVVPRRQIVSGFVNAYGAYGHFRRGVRSTRT
ncbi:hypothetical protein RCH17_001723 [Arthrobacter sp. MP_M7]|nr:hypothetical protein [Arthrobacter sp. MP_M4]MEC5202917.1 hypothetical protein [Arthrobacter sp. MP_M7]